jgi:hypothetical protein
MPTIINDVIFINLIALCCKSLTNEEIVKILSLSENEFITLAE